MPIQRYKLTCAYRGTRYHGWQFQYANRLWKGPKPKAGEGIPTVQENLQKALAYVLAHPVTIHGSSRTDAGVHAKGQIAHFDTDKVQVPIEGMRRAVNHALPDDIIVRSIVPVPPDFESNIWTTRKRYQYCIWNAEDRPVFNADLVWHRWQPIDVGLMREAASQFVGRHDFTSFARAKDPREDATREIFDCSISARGPRIVFGIEGSGFLWNMIRIMVGTMVEIGLDYRRPETITAMLAAKDRRVAGATAPPHGLYLQWIKTREIASADPLTDII